MALTAQDKILHVANKLGLSTLGQMQGSTGAVYDVDTDISGQLFTNSTRHQFPSITNLTENKFEVNEALLVESIGFYVKKTTGGADLEGVSSLQRTLGSNVVVVFSLIIGNKKVIKEVPVFAAGMPYTFASIGNTLTNSESQQFIPRANVFMEGAGILIPPQVEFSVEYRVFNLVTGASVEITDAAPIGCYLFGTRVLLNFNTSI